MGQEWDKGRNQKVSGNKWKWIQNRPKPMGGSPIGKAVLRKKFIEINTNLEKQALNNLTLQFNELEREK